ncbi:MAG: methyltransferase [Flavobacteriaceae bacterium]|nr:methyltransferase [Flavobacteriaceae bacterium]
MAKPFYFKKFSISQDRCAMKVGTDSVLLGAWSSLNHSPKTILDIGSGTGILALILAQRSFAEIIDAIEIEAEAYKQCVHNFESSNWADRLFCYHASLEEFIVEIDESYDLIISNPPFYTDNFKSGNKVRDKARFEEALPFKELLNSASKLLSKTGQINIIIPFKEETNFISLAEKVGLFPSRITRVRGQKDSPLKRSLICLTFKPQKIDINELAIEINRHQYTDEYIDLTKDFYLKL